MPEVKKKVHVAQWTVSEPVMHNAKPAKRSKKSKLSATSDSADVMAACPPFHRSVSLLVPGSPSPVNNSTDDGSLLTSNSSSRIEATPTSSSAVVARRRSAAEDTTKHLFGPYADPKLQPPRRWEVDSYGPLFGPDGQLFSADRPRHYDVFDLHSGNTKALQRRQHHKNELENLPEQPPADKTDPEKIVMMSKQLQESYDRMFGPEGQMFATENPRHYDVFDLQSGYSKAVQRRQQFKDERERCASPHANEKTSPPVLMAKRLFGDNPADVAPTELTARPSRQHIVNHPTAEPGVYDVFEPYRDMTCRPRKLKTKDSHEELFGAPIERQMPSYDYATHERLFGIPPKVEVRKMIKNPARFARKTPKIVEDVVYSHLQPTLRPDPQEALKTGKARPKSNSPPRNPLTWDGYATPLSIAQPDRGRQLKPAAEGIPVQMPDDARNPITGLGMRTSEDKLRSVLDAEARRKTFWAPERIEADAVRPTNHSSRRRSAAHTRMFNRHTPLVYPDEPTPVAQQPATESSESAQDGSSSGAVTPTAKPSKPAVDDIGELQPVTVRYSRKRLLRPPEPTDGRRIVAWSKSKGQADDQSYYVADPPMIRRLAPEIASPITGRLVVQRARIATSGVDDSPRTPRPATTEARTDVRRQSPPSYTIDDDEDENNDDDDDDADTGDDDDDDVEQ